VVVLGTVGCDCCRLFSSWQQAFDFPPEARRLDPALMRAMGAAGLLAMYNYGGYSNVCNIGEELKTPEKTLPRAIVLSIVVVVVLYVVMSTVILGMIPWREAEQTRTIARCSCAHNMIPRTAARGAGDDRADSLRHRIISAR
jgi:amino acid transporter